MAVLCKCKKCVRSNYTENIRILLSTIWKAEKEIQQITEDKLDNPKMPSFRVLFNNGLNNMGLCVCLPILTPLNILCLYACRRLHGANVRGKKLGLHLIVATQLKILSCLLIVYPGIVMFHPKTLACQKTVVSRRHREKNTFCEI